MSNPSDSDWKRMVHLIDDFMKRPDCEPFREPVPWAALGLVDYPTIIKLPMDLGTVKKKVKKKEYSTLYQCAEDVRLVWSNCMTYNADGSDFFKLAETLKKRWNSNYAKLLQDIGGNNSTATEDNANSSSSGGGKVSLQDKRNMAKLLYQITKEDLGKVLVDIEHKCPAAIKRNAAEDELELNIDAITAPVMQDLMKHLQTLKGAGKKKVTTNKAKKAKTAPAAS